ncbi:MAG: queuosine precursor transporter [Bacteroidales bacterium]|nr:queuosine precursor transporter [Bacteroidales bacterium]
MKKKPTQVSVLFLFFATLFTVCLIVSNLFAVKPFSVGPVSFTGAIILFPVSYIVNDIVSEVWGFRRAKTLIWMAFALNFFVVLMGFIVDALPGAPWWSATSSEGFHSVFGLAPRVAVASFLAFLVGSFVNAAVMSKMKVRSQGRYFSLRAVVSTLLGESSDSLIFFPIALAGTVIPWSQMPKFVLWQVGLKTTYELLVLPITVRIVRRVKEHEQTDIYDRDIKYKIF